MNNKSFTNKIRNHKNEILNFFDELSSGELIFNFLNKNECCGRLHIGTREQWSGSHIRVVNRFETGTKYSNTHKDWYEYDDPQGYYITFNGYENFKDDHSLSVSIRKDLVLYWSQVDTSNVNVLFISEITDEIYVIPVKNILRFIANNKDIEVNYNGFADYIIPLSNETYTECRKQNHNEYNGNYDTQYFLPEYIGEFTYSYHRTGTSIKIAIFNNGKYVKEQIFRSISELYHVLVTNLYYFKSCKSLQRSIAKEEVVHINGSCDIYITSDLERDIKSENIEIVEVVDETIDNVLFCPDLPEDETNPRVLVTRTHKEIKKSPRKDYEEHFKDIEEIVYFDDDTQTMIRDYIKDANEKKSSQKEFDEYVEYLKKECERAKLSDDESLYVSTIVDYKEWSKSIRLYQDEFAGSLF